MSSLLTNSFQIIPARLLLATGARQQACGHRLTGVRLQLATGARLLLATGARLLPATGARLLLATGARLLLATCVRLLLATGARLRRAAAAGHRRAAAAGCCTDSLNHVPARAVVSSIDSGSAICNTENRLEVLGKDESGDKMPELFSSSGESSGDETQCASAPRKVKGPAKIVQ